MFYQVEKATQKIAGISDINNFGEMKPKYELKESVINFEVGDIFEETQERLVESIRTERNKRLSETDKFMLPDFPITQEQKTEIQAYRQALRNLPETITLKNPVFPEKPNFI